MEEPRIEHWGKKLIRLFVFFQTTYKLSDNAIPFPKHLITILENGRTTLND